MKEEAKMAVSEAELKAIVSAVIAQVKNGEDIPKAQLGIFNDMNTAIAAAKDAQKIIEAQTVCPGKYIVIFEGDISAVRAPVDAAASRYPEQLIDSFLLGNPHEGIFPAIYGTADIKNRNALGVLETFDAAAIFVAAVSAAISKAEAAVSERGMYLDSSVIASPDAQLWDTVL